MIREEDADVIILCETWLKPETCYRLSGFSVYRCDREYGYGGVALLVKNCLIHKKIDLDHSGINYECVGIEVQLAEKFKINFLSLYAPPNTIITYNHWRAALNQLSGNVFLAGDFNGHSFSWGCSFEDLP